MVRFSNLSSPEYIMDLGGRQVNKLETPPRPPKKNEEKRKRRGKRKTSQDPLLSPQVTTLTAGQIGFGPQYPGSHAGSLL